MPSVSMRQMLEAGVHFGHQTRFWNPRMDQYIFGERNRSTSSTSRRRSRCSRRPANFVEGVVADGGKVLFVGTKRQAREAIEKEAAALRHALRQPALARRHAHQLQDHPGLDQAPEGAGRDPRTARSSKHAKKEAHSCGARRQAREEPGRHPEDGSASGRHVHDRRRPRRNRDPGSQEARHPGRRGGGHQLRARQRRLRDSRQR